MSRRFQDIDLSRLPAPPAIEALDYEAILAARIADFKARWEAVRVLYPDLPPYDVEMLETDPVVVVEQSNSYHDMLLRGRVNDAVRAVMLATAWGGNLDHLGARVGALASMARLMRSIVGAYSLPMRPCRPPAPTAPMSGTPCRRMPA